MYYLRGDTYSLRHDLKKMFSAKWNNDRYQWYCLDEETAKKAQKYIDDIQREIDEKEAKEKAEKLAILKEQLEKEKKQVCDALDQIDPDFLPSRDATKQAIYILKKAYESYASASENEEFREFYANHEEFCQVVRFGRNLRKSGFKSFCYDTTKRRMNFAAEHLGWIKTRNILTRR